MNRHGRTNHSLARGSETDADLMAPSLRASLLLVLLLSAPWALAAQQIAGEYQVEVKGATYYLDREPEEKQLRDNTTLTIEQEGETIELTFGSFASAMSMTRFRGYVGNNRFVATWSSGSNDGQSKVITGEVSGPRLRGRLIYSRAHTGATVPGWTEVEFAAARQERSAGQSGGSRPSAVVPGGSAKPPQSGRRLPNLRPNRVPGLGSSGSTSADGQEAAQEPLTVDLSVFLVPEKPTARQRITFTAGIPRSSAVDVARIELFVGGKQIGTSRNRYFDVTAGPYPAGRLEYRAVVYDTAGRSKVTVGDVMIEAKGPYGRIHGRVSGNVRIVDGISVASESRGVVAEIEPNSSGYYSVSYLPPGDYWLTVNSGKNPTIDPGEQIRVRVSANQSTVQDFTVK